MNYKHKSTLEKYFKILKNELNYSDNTVNCYSLHLKEFLEYFNKSGLHLTYSDFKDFVLEYQFTSRSKHNQFISAVRLFYKHMLNYKIKDNIFNRPRKHKYLPTILSQEEIRLLLNSIHNKKHRAIIATIYYFGLRISELINLKMSDFDNSRRELHIRQSKFNKDRIIPYQKIWIKIFRDYYLDYEPTHYAFEGQNGLYSKTSVRNILIKGLKNARINKHIKVHELRHSYASHLYENGTNLATIQRLLGHVNYRSTLIYTQITTKCLEMAIL